MGMEPGGRCAPSHAPQGKRSEVWALRAWHAASQYLHQPPETMVRTLNFGSWVSLYCLGNQACAFWTLCPGRRIPATGRSCPAPPAEAVLCVSSDAWQVSRVSLLSLLVQLLSLGGPHVWATSSMRGRGHWVVWGWAGGGDDRAPWESPPLPGKVASKGGSYTEHAKG